jgi:hypothetical protein
MNFDFEGASAFGESTVVAMQRVATSSGRIG